MGKHEGRRTFGTARRKMENNIKIDLREVLGSMNWINLARDRHGWRALVNAVMNFQFP